MNNLELNDDSSIRAAEALLLVNKAEQDKFNLCDLCRGGHPREMAGAENRWVHKTGFGKVIIDCRRND